MFIWRKLPPLGRSLIVGIAILAIVAALILRSRADAREVDEAKGVCAGVQRVLDDSKLSPLDAWTRISERYEDLDAFDPAALTWADQCPGTVDDLNELNKFVAVGADGGIPRGRINDDNETPDFGGGTPVEHDPVCDAERDVLNNNYDSGELSEPEYQKAIEEQMDRCYWQTP